MKLFLGFFLPRANQKLGPLAPFFKLTEGPRVNVLHWQTARDHLPRMMERLHIGIEE